MDNTTQTRRINNLTVRLDRQSLKWRVIAPDGVVLEEFYRKDDALECAGDIHDYLSDAYRMRKYNSVQRPR